MSNERRANERINAALPINYETIDTAEKHYGNTISKDISPGGIKILIDKFYPHKTKFLLRVQLGNNHKMIEGVTESVWSFNEPYSNRYHSGLRFIDMNKEYQNILKQFISIQTILV